MKIKYHPTASQAAQKFSVKARVRIRNSIALRSLRQEDWHNFEASVDLFQSPSQKIQN